MRLVLNHISSFDIFEFSFSICCVWHLRVAVHVDVLVSLLTDLPYILNLLWLQNFLVRCWSLSNSFFALCEFHTLEQITVKFFADLCALLVRFFHALICTHTDEVLTWWFILSISKIESIILLISRWSIRWRWHQPISTAQVRIHILLLLHLR